MFLFIDDKIDVICCFVLFKYLFEDVNFMFLVWLGIFCFFEMYDMLKYLYVNNEFDDLILIV